METTRLPTRYRVVVSGRLGEHLACAFDTCELETVPGGSALTGTFQDQAALHGFLDRLGDLGIPIVSVNPVE